MQLGSRHKLSKKNPYRLESRFREYELIYFCLQYPEWKKRLASLSVRGTEDEWSDPTGEEAVERAMLSTKIDMVEKAVRDAAGDLYIFLLKGITENLSYTNLKTYYNMPCSSDRYFRLRHKVYYLLSQEKQRLL